MNIRKWFVLLIFSSVSLIAQSVGYPTTNGHLIRQWDLEDGLVSDYISGITKCQQGFIWATTHEGLLRFDGSSFYTFSQVNTPSLKTDDFTCIALLSDSSLIVGTKFHGLLRFKNNRFTSISLPGDANSNSIRKISVSDNGNVFTATENGLFVLQGDSVFLLDPTTLGHQINDVFTAVDGKVYAAVQSFGIKVFDNKLNFLSEESIRDKRLQLIQSVYLDRNGNLWAATHTETFSIRNKILTKRARNGNNYLISGTEAGQIFLGANDGLKFLMGKNHEIEITLSGLSDPRIRSIYIEDSSTIWIGTYHGLNRLSRSSINVIAKAPEQWSQNIRAVFQDSKGNVWLGTYLNGIRKITKNGESFVFPELIRKSIWSFYENAGRIYAGTDGGVIEIFDDKITLYQSEQFRNSSFTAISKPSLNSNQLLCGTNLGELFTFTNGRFKELQKNLPVNDYVFSIKTFNDTTWVLTEWGAFTGKLENGNIALKAKIPGKSIRVMLKDECCYWFGSSGQGLLRLKEGKLTSYSKAEGLFSKDIWGLVEDEHGNLWMSCDEGVFFINKKDCEKFDEGKISAIPHVNFGMNEGLPTNECNSGSNSGFIDADGNIWFPTLKNAIYFNHDDMMKSLGAAKVFVSHITMGEKVTFPDDEIIIPAEIENFQVQFGALNFGNNAQLVFRYKLNEFNESWHFTGKRRTAFLSNLSPGIYNITIEADNGTNEWNAEPASMSFEIEPAFYQTFLFRLLMALIGFGSILLFVRIRMRSVREHNLELQAEVDKRRQAEHQIQLSAERYKRLSEATFEGIGVSKEGKIIDVNPQLCKILGYTREELFEGGLRSVVHPEDMQIVARNMKNPVSGPYTHRAIHKDGSVLHLEVRAELIKEDNEEFRLTVIRDITDYVNSREELIKSQQSLRLHIEQTPLAVIEWDLDFKVKFWNSAAEHIFGFTKEEAIGKPASFFVPDSASVQVNSVWEILRNRSGGSRSTNENLTKDGRLIVCEWYNTLLVDSEGKEIGVASLGMDITRRHKALAALEKSEEKLRGLTDNLPGVAYQFFARGDGSMGFHYIHPNAEEMLGLKTETGNELEDFISRIPAGHQDTFMEAIREGISKPDKWDVTVPFVKPAGELIYTRCISTPIITEDEIVFNGVLIDVTDTVKLEKMMIESEKMVSIAGLAAGMAHEINNPLGTIIQGCQNIRRRTSRELAKNIEMAKELGLDYSVFEEYLKQRQIGDIVDSIYGAAVKASDIIKNMLQFSRKGDSQKVKYNVNSLLDGVIELAGNDYDLKKKYDFRDISIIKNYQVDLPEFSMSVTEIEQVFFNLLRNAAHAMRSDKMSSRSPEIKIETLQTENFVEISISDNGPGIPEKAINRIFEPFFTTKDIGEGTGLGLSVSYMIITKNHNGTISVENLPEGGAAFTVRLPLNGGDSSNE